MRPLIGRLVKATVLVSQGKLELNLLLSFGVAPVQRQSTVVRNYFNLVVESTLTEHEEHVGLVADYVLWVDCGDLGEDTVGGGHSGPSGVQHHIVVLVLLLHHRDAIADPHNIH